MTNQSFKRAIRAYQSEHGVSYTAAHRAVTALRRQGLRKDPFEWNVEDLTFYLSLVLNGHGLAAIPVRRDLMRVTGSALLRLADHRDGSAAWTLATTTVEEMTGADRLVIGSGRVSPDNLWDTARTVLNAIAEHRGRVLDVPDPDVEPGLYGACGVCGTLRVLDQLLPATWPRDEDWGAGSLMWGDISEIHQNARAAGDPLVCPSCVFEADAGIQMPLDWLYGAAVGMSQRLDAAPMWAGVAAVLSGLLRGTRWDIVGERESAPLFPVLDRLPANWWLGHPHDVLDAMGAEAVARLGRNDPTFTLDPEAMPGWLESEAWSRAEFSAFVEIEDLRDFYPPESLTGACLYLGPGQQAPDGMLANLPGAASHLDGRVINGLGVRGLCLPGVPIPVHLPAPSWVRAHANPVLADAIEVAGPITTVDALVRLVDHSAPGLMVTAYGEILRGALGSVPFEDRPNAVEPTDLHRLETLVSSLLDARLDLLRDSDFTPLSRLDPGADLPGLDQVLAIADNCWDTFCALWPAVLTCAISGATTCAESHDPQAPSPWAMAKDWDSVQNLLATMLRCEHLAYNGDEAEERYAAGPAPEGFIAATWSLIPVLAESLFPGVLSDSEIEEYDASALLVRDQHRQPAFPPTNR